MQEVLLFKSLGSPSGVVLPEKNRLVVDELDARRGDNLPSEFLALQKIKKV